MTTTTEQFAHALQCEESIGGADRLTILHGIVSEWSEHTRAGLKRQEADGESVDWEAHGWFEREARAALDELREAKNRVTLLTTAQAAEQLGITQETVQQARKRGAFPGAVKRGRDWHLPLSAVLEYEQSRRPRPKRGRGPC